MASPSDPRFPGGLPTSTRRRAAARTKSLEAVGRDRAHGNVVVGLIDALEHDVTVGGPAGALREAYDAPYDPLRGTERPA